MRLLVHSSLCTGCMNCQTVCALVHSGKQDPAASLIRVCLDLFGGRHSHKYCRQCSPAPCAEACPGKAITRDSLAGALLVNQECCIGCGSCVNACPFNAISLNQETGLAQKCDLCGGTPACADACLFNVIELVD